MNQVLSNMTSQSNTTKETIIQLLSNLANPKEIDQYLKRFVNAGKTNFAVIKVGGGILENDMDNLCSSLAFLQQIGLYPIVVHGAGPQINRKLSEAKIKGQFIDGQRVTDAQVLSIAKKTFVEENLNLSNRLQSMDVKAASITSGVFQGKFSENRLLGYVGEITQVDLDPIKMAIKNGAIPVLSSMAETKEGQSLNINADMATRHLAITLKPYKIIFLTETGGVLDQQQQLISTINLVTDYDQLMSKEWLHGGMRLKIKQIAEILSQMPATTSVSMTRPSHLAKELFTHKGSGTLIRKGESIMQHETIETIKRNKLTLLIESGFGKKLIADYFEQNSLFRAFITYCYRAAAVVTKETEFPFLDKYAVDDSAKGEGLGSAVWQELKKNIPQLFWRSRINNTINQFYFNHCDGCFKSGEWIVFWYGITDMQQIKNCIEYAVNKPETLIAGE